MDMEENNMLTYKFVDNIQMKCGEQRKKIIGLWVKSKSNDEIISFDWMSR